VVVEGAVSVNLIDGLREKVLYTVEPGQLCVHTLTNLINDREYQATAIAQKDTQVGWMDATSFRFMRQDHGVTHTLGLASTGDWLMPLLLVVSAQLFVIVFGAIAMQTHAYLPRVWRGYKVQRDLLDIERNSSGVGCDDNLGLSPTHARIFKRA